MQSQSYLLNTIRNFLSPISKILILKKPYNSPVILTSDLDEDGMLEIIVGYEYKDETYVLILKNSNNSWYPLANFKGNWYNLSKICHETPFVLKERTITLYPASLKTARGTKWGYIDHNGKFNIKPKYDSAMNFQRNDLAVVQVNNLFGIINLLGNYIVTPQYGSISEFSEGRSIVIDNKGFKIIDEAGKVLTPKAYSYIGTFHEGRAQFSDTNKVGDYLYGYLDKEGKEVIPLKYQSANDFINGKALVKINKNQFALINLKGEIINNYKYPYLGPYGDGLLVYKESLDGISGYINEDGKVILPLKYHTAMAFNEGSAIVNMSDGIINKLGVINKKGDFIIKPLYNNITYLGEKRFAIGKAINEKQPFIGSKYSITDINGIPLTDFIYTNVTTYKKGLGTACDNKNIFFIDISGKMVKTLPIVMGCGSLSLQGDIIQANIDNRLSYLNKSGKTIWRQNNIIPLNNLFTLIEKKYKPNKDYLVYYPQVNGIKLKEAENAANKHLKDLSNLNAISSDAQLDYSYFGDFSVEFFNKNLLVLDLIGNKMSFGAAHGMTTKTYPHIDLVSGVLYRLEDLFIKNSNYVKVLSDIIATDIKTKEEYSYIFPGTYKGIQENQPFYVHENFLFIYFNLYEIAPYAAGFPTFKIPFTQINSILNTNGNFWKSFH